MQGPKRLMLSVGKRPHPNWVVYLFYLFDVFFVFN